MRGEGNAEEHYAGGEGVAPQSRECELQQQHYWSSIYDVPGMVLMSQSIYLMGSLHQRPWRGYMAYILREKQNLRIDECLAKDLTVSEWLNGIQTQAHLTPILKNWVMPKDSYFIRWQSRETLMSCQQWHSGTYWNFSLNNVAFVVQSIPPFSCLCWVEISPHPKAEPALVWRFGFIL